MKSDNLKIALPMLLVSCGGIASMPHMIDGKTSDQIFDQVAVASLADAACEGDNAAMGLAIAEVDTVDYEGHIQVTPLIWAITCENVEGVSFLLSNGADPNKKTEHGLSPMTLAAVVPDVEILTALIEAGGDINANEGARLTSVLEQSLLLGKNQNYWANFDLLMERGASVEAPFVRDVDVYSQLAMHGQFKKLLDLVESEHQPSDISTIVKSVFNPHFQDRHQLLAKSDLVQVFIDQGVDVMDIVLSWRERSEIAPELEAINQIRMEKGLEPL